MLESPLFAREVEQKTIERAPVVEVIKRNPREIVLSALLRMSEQMPFYIFTVFVLEYPTEDLGFEKTFATNAEVAREFEEGAKAPVPETARASERRVAAGVS